MKLSEAVAAADGGPIRISNAPEFPMQVIDGRFFFVLAHNSDLTAEPVSLTLEQIESNQWEYEKKTWEGKAPRAKKDEAK